MSAYFTRKWLVATAVGAIGLVVMLLTGDRATITDAEIIAIGTFGVQRITAWAVPNTASDGAHAMARAQKGEH